MDANAPDDGGRHARIKAAILARLTALRLSGSQASDKAGLGRSYVNDILSGKSLRPDRPKLERLALALECKASELIGDPEELGSKPLAAVSASGEFVVYGVAMAGADGFGTLSRPVPFTPFVRPPQDAYGLIVPDDSMAPRYGAGECVIVLRDRIASGGRFAALRLRDGRVAVRRIDLIRGGIVSVSTLDGRPAQSIQAADVLGIDRVWGISECAAAA